MTPLSELRKVEREGGREGGREGEGGRQGGGRERVCVTPSRVVFQYTVHVRICAHTSIYMLKSMLDPQTNYNTERVAF